MMQAIILNSGTGSRMGKLTEHNPKCLLPLKENRLILTEQIEALIASGVGDIVITTGKYHDEIKEEIEKRNYGVSVTYVRNPEYDSTNYIYSLFLAREFLGQQEIARHGLRFSNKRQSRFVQDVLLLHGDLVFDRKLFEKFAADARPNLLMVSKSDVLPEKDFKAKIVGGYIQGVSVTYKEACRFCLPLYKLEKCAFQIWMEQITEFVEAGRKGVYAEEALNLAADKMKIEPYYFDGFCAEVDCAEDYESALAYYSTV